MSFSLHKFYSDASARAKRRGERQGQAAYNHLQVVRPDLSAKVCATDMDPYYSESWKDPKWNRFVQFIETNWYILPSDNVVNTTVTEEQIETWLRERAIASNEYSRDMARSAINAG